MINLDVCVVFLKDENLEEAIASVASMVVTALICTVRIKNQMFKV
jgi:hypothetical protein